MAEINPPLYLDQDEAYGADELGLPYRDIMGEGIVGVGDLLVTASAGLKSSVAPGAAWVTGDDDPTAQPCYRMRNDAAVLLQHDAADATNARIDLVIAEVMDATFSGVSKLWRLRIVKGTPGAVPAAPALPVNAIALATVTIPAGSGTLGTITDKRTRATVGGGQALSASQAVVTVVGASTDSTTGVTTTGTGDVFAAFPAATFLNVLHFLDFHVYIEDGAGNATLQFYLMDGASQVATWYYKTPAVSPGAPAFVRIPFTPTAGAHTYSVKYRDVTTGRTYTIRGTFGGPWSARISRAV